MKNKGLFAVITIIAVSAAGFAGWEFLKKKKGITRLSKGPDYYVVSAHPANAAKTFSGFNYNLILDSQTVNGEAEITALQQLINAYYGGTPNSVPVTGTWNAQTQAAVEAIEGKGSTNLYEFRYFYFDPQRGDAMAMQILQNLTTQVG